MDEKRHIAERRRRPSRAMLSGELSWAFIALAFALIGSGLWPYGEGYLYRVIERGGFAASWPWMTIPPSVWLLGTALHELLGNRRRDWPTEKVVRSVMCRGWANAWLLFCWLYVIYALARIGLVSLIITVAVGGAAFSLWFIWENRRVQREFR